MTGLPDSARRRHAYADGYAARLGGTGRYGVPYELRGWAAALAYSWWEGWDAADAITDPRPDPPRPTRRGKRKAPA